VSGGSLQLGSIIARSSTFDLGRQDTYVAVDGWSEFGSCIDVEALELVRA
jgi:hypothetical protein